MVTESLKSTPQGQGFDPMLTTTGYCQQPTNPATSAMIQANVRVRTQSIISAAKATESVPQPFRACKGKVQGYNNHRKFRKQIE